MATYNIKNDWGSLRLYQGTVVCSTGHLSSLVWQFEARDDGGAGHSTTDVVNILPNCWYRYSTFKQDSWWLALHRLCKSLIDFCFKSRSEVKDNGVYAKLDNKSESVIQLNLICSSNWPLLQLMLGAGSPPSLVQYSLRLAPSLTGLVLCRISIPSSL